MYTAKNNTNKVFIGFRGVARILPCSGFGLRPDYPSLSPPKVGGLHKNVVFYVSKIKVLEFCNKLWRLLTRRGLK
jgi:hypothetical protein